jgi:hypothetical protein
MQGSKLKYAGVLLISIVLPCFIRDMIIIYSGSLLYVQVVWRQSRVKVKLSHNRPCRPRGL